MAKTEREMAKKATKKAKRGIDGCPPLSHRMGEGSRGRGSLFRPLLLLCLALCVWRAMADEPSPVPCTEAIQWTGDAAPSDSDVAQIQAVGCDTAAMESFVAAYTNSPWTPSVRNVLASRYRLT